MKTSFKKQFYIFKSLLIFLGITSFLFLTVINKKFLSLFTIDKQVSEFYSEIILSSQYLIITVSSLFFILFLIIKYDIVKIRKDNINIYLLVIVILKILFLGEISIRFIKPTKNKSFLMKHSLLYEPSSFTVHRFKDKQVIYDQNSDSVRVIINNGFRGRSFSMDKPVDEIRIVILGGSFVFNWNKKGVENDWPHLVQKELNDKGISNVKIINGGVPSHKSFDAIGRLYSEIHYLNPDYVVLCNAWNDIKYFRKISPKNNPFRSLRPLTVPTVSELTNHNFLQWILDNFHLYKTLSMAINSFGESKYGFEGRIDEYGPLESYPDTISAYALKQYQLNVNVFVDICKNINATPILMVQPRLISSYNSKEEISKINYRFSGLSHDGLLSAFSKCDSILKYISNTRSIDLIDLHPYISGRSEFFDDHVHLTPAGSEKFANMVALSLENIILN